MKSLLLHSSDKLGQILLFIFYTRRGSTGTRTVSVSDREEDRNSALGFFAVNCRIGAVSDKSGKMKCKYEFQN